MVRNSKKQSPGQRPAKAGATHPPATPHGLIGAAGQGGSSTLNQPLPALPQPASV